MFVFPKRAGGRIEREGIRRLDNRQNFETKEGMHLAITSGKERDLWLVEFSFSLPAALRELAGERASKRWGAFNPHRHLWVFLLQLKHAKLWQKYVKSKRNRNCAATCSEWKLVNAVHISEQACILKFCCVLGRWCLSLPSRGFVF